MVLPKTSKHLPTVSRIIAAGICCSFLAGCGQYLSHRDTVTLNAGNANAANVAIHTIDPQAHRADNTLIYTDGKNVRRIMDNYHNRPKTAPDTLSAETPSGE